jgi:sRNA-binding carbon storage regulator CsrA
MLVLTRNKDEEIILITNQYEDDPDKKNIIKIRVLKISPTRVKLGFDTGENVRILRADLQEDK